MSDSTQANSSYFSLSAIQARAVAAWEGAKDLARTAVRAPTEQEQKLMQAGLTHFDAIQFLRAGAPTTEEQWLMTKHMTPLQARAFAKTPLKPYETALIIGGVHPEKARADATNPVSRQQVFNVLELAFEQSNVAISGREWMDFIYAEARAIVNASYSNQELFDTSATLKGNSQLLANAVVEDARERLIPGYASQKQASVKRQDAASQQALSPQSENVQHQVAEAVEPMTARPVDAIKKAAVATLTQAQQKGFSELVAKAFTDADLTADEAKAIQRGLNERGYQAGTEDGNLGSKSWLAIARYADAGNLPDVPKNRSVLKNMEASLAVIGYRGLEVDGKMDGNTKRALSKFFALRREGLGDLAPADVAQPDFAAIAAVHSAYHHKRGNVPKADSGVR